MTPTPQHDPAGTEPDESQAAEVGPGAEHAHEVEGPTRPAWLRLGAVGALAAGVLAVGTLAQGDVRLPGAGSTLADGAVGTHATDGTGATSAPDGTADDGPGAAPAAVTSSALGCPGVPLAAASADDEAATSRPGPAQDGSAGSVVAARVPADLTQTLSDVPAQGGAELTLTGADGVTSLGEAPLSDILEPDVAALVTGEGSAAPGLVAGQLTLADRPADRWLGLAACTPAAEEQWLLGGGDAAGRTEEIVLTNPGPDAATVDIEVWGSGGPATTTGATGVVVPGHGRVTRLLDALAPSVQAPVVRITASGSPVSAHLVDQWRDGTTDLGGELTSTTTAPATDLVVPAPPRGPAQDAEVVLRLLAPEGPAVVDLTALTEEGAVPLSAHVTSLDPGQVQDVPLEELPDGVLALRVRSTAPVTAAASVALAPSSDEPVDLTDTSAAPTEVPADEDQADGAGATEEPASPAEPLVRPGGEIAWTAGVLASATPLGMGLPDRTGVPGAQARLTLSAMDASQATVVWVDEDGGVGTEDVGLVPNDTTLVLDVPEEARAVWVVPGQGGALVGSVQLVGEDRRGPYLSSATLPATAWTRAVNDVQVVSP